MSDNINVWVLSLLVSGVAFLYASVGFGGGSGYLAVMSLYNTPATLASSTALSLNLVVAGVAFINYFRQGHFKPHLLLPFVLTSIPAAFLGGMIKVGQDFYMVLLNTVLLYLAIRMLFSRDNNPSHSTKKPPSFPLALAVGVGLGLLSGILGIGGGIFLSPLILIAGWGEPKQAAASSAGFIFLNSLAGLGGRFSNGTLQFGDWGWLLMLLGILGGIIGSYLGARYFSGIIIRRLLGVVLLVAVLRFLFSWLG